MPSICHDAIATEQSRSKTLTSVSILQADPNTTPQPRSTTTSYAVTFQKQNPDSGGFLKPRNEHVTSPAFQQSPDPFAIPISWGTGYGYFL
ncbi:uncharacterized protein N7473_000202 [Penicillium subrubescens]|uniref:uncharacterized protein n=1 Tax=Penicillium subrubescens TaxID=1316194 RepID=UPI002544DA48|nr:uncharacterized protein N7473_000202 [Penicillium subrubescens]KAJ5910899.1 hypothetical protein N7473_000202 [Penicillium subrubescens]